MANPEHESKIREGVDNWNAWRNANIDVEPDLNGLSGPFEDSEFFSSKLEYANLANTNLKNANFQGVSLKASKLIKANLRNVDFTDANLQHIDFQGADLTEAILKNTVASGAILKNVDLTNAELQGADLQVVNFTRARLDGANFTGTKLEGANFTEAKLYRTRFTSQTSLSYLAHPLTNDQISGCIFDDEVSEAESEQRDSKPVGYVRFPDNGPWTPMNMGLFLGAFQLAYNRTQYLLTTEDEDEVVIENVLAGRAELDASHNIQIGTMTRGSTIFQLISTALDSDNLELAIATVAAVGMFTLKLYSLRIESRKTRIQEQEEQREQDLHHSRLQQTAWEAKEAREKALTMREERLKIKTSMPVPQDLESKISMLASPRGMNNIFESVLMSQYELEKAVASLEVNSSTVEKNKVLYLTTANAQLIAIAETLKALQHGDIEITTTLPPD